MDNNNQHNNKAKDEVTYKLPAVSEYYTQYKTSQGRTVTFKVAISPNITVNTTIGVLVIKPSGLSLDVTNDIITPEVLNTKPFPVVFKHTSRCDPNIRYTPTSGARELTYEDHPYVTDEEVSKCINLVDVFIDPSKEPDSDNPGSKVTFTDHVEKLAVVADPSLKRKATESASNDTTSTSHYVFG